MSVEPIYFIVGRIRNAIDDLEHYQPKGNTETPSENFKVCAFTLRDEINTLIRRLPKNQ